MVQLVGLFGRSRGREGTRGGSARPAPARPSARSASDGEDGYAAVDALVALTILATTLVFGVAAIHTGSQAARSALEARQARAVLEAALERAPATPGVTQAADGRFAWRLVVHEPELVGGSIALCRRDATVSALATARRYALSTSVICPSDET